MNNIILLIMGLVTLALVIISIIYVSRRFTRYFGFNGPRPLYILFTALYILSNVGFRLTLNSTGFLMHMVHILSVFMMGYLLYLGFAVLLVGIAKKFIKLKPGNYGIAALILPLFVLGYGVWNSNHVRTTEIEVSLKGLSKEFKVMHIADIHLGHFWRESSLQAIVDETNKQNVDAVFITGDFIDGRIAFHKKYFEPLKKMHAPTYFVGGNHDKHTGLEFIEKNLENVGVIVLKNQILHLGELQVIGLEYMLEDGDAFDKYSLKGRPTIKEVLKGMTIEASKPAILLHHSPVGLQYANESGIDLYLAGHTHAGQIFPVNLLGRPLYRFDRGLHDYKGTTVFVSQGAGTFGPPLRVGTFSEITVITLKPTKSH